MPDPATSKPHAFVLAVHDLAGTAGYLRDVLGFRTEWRDEDRWQALVRDEVRVMLGRCPNASPVDRLGDHAYFAFIATDDIDRLHDAFAEKGASSDPLHRTGRGAGGRWRWRRRKVTG